MAQRKRKSIPTRANALTRTKLVWASLVACMTGVGGALMLATGGLPAVDGSGTTLSPLMRLSGPRTMDAALQTREPVAPGRWSRIVVHHTGSPFGTPESLSEAHRGAGLAGLGYHFVIGNGSGLADGEVHIGYRWLDQLPSMDVVNETGTAGETIRIALVGDGDRRPFTDEQVARLAELVAVLTKRCELSEGDVVMHREIAGTSSPGRFFPDAAFRERVRVLTR